MAFASSHFAAANAGSPPDDWKAVAGSPFSQDAPPKTDFVAATPRDRPLVQALQNAVGDIHFATTSFEGFGVRTFVTGDEEQFAEWRAGMAAGEDELLLMAFHPGSSGEFTLSDEAEVRFCAAAGAKFREACAGIQDVLADRRVRNGVEDLLGRDAEATLKGLSSAEIFSSVGFAGLSGILRLATATNALRAAGTRLYRDLAAQGWDLTNMPALLAKIIPADLQTTLHGIISRSVKANTPLPTQQLMAGAQDLVQGLFAGVEKLLRKVPNFGWLIQQLWAAFDTLLKGSGSLYNTLLDLAEARDRFETALLKSVGKTIYQSLLAGPSAATRGNVASARELAIGGVFIGQIPFVIGTVYQIIYDILDTVVQLIRFGFFAAKGLGKYLYAQLTAPPPAAQQVSASGDLLSAMLFDFDLEKLLTKDLPSFISLATGMMGQLLRAFIDNATEFGGTVGTWIVKGTLAVGAGALNLLVGDYPGRNGVLSRLWWNVKKWFNIGCLIGPVVVDVVLFFCSGGALGVFSAAAKLGKLGKAGQAFRFAGKSMEGLKKLKLFGAVGGSVPKPLRLLLDKWLSQVWALVAKASDVVAVTLGGINKKIGSPVPTGDLEALVKRLDDMYEVAGAAHFFAAIAFLFLGGPETVVTQEAKVSAA